MDNSIKKFVEEYNKRSDWNKEIIEGFNTDFVSIEVKEKIIGNFLSTDKITKDEYDLKNAKCYSYEDGLELQVFNNKTLGTHYFWIKPIENKEEYKEERKNVVNKIINEYLEKIIPEIDKLTISKEELLKLKNILS